jgi:hypothetical protein
LFQIACPSAVQLSGSPGGGMMSPHSSWLSFKACATASLVATGPVCEV